MGGGVDPGCPDLLVVGRRARGPRSPALVAPWEIQEQLAGFLLEEVEILMENSITWIKSACLSGLGFQVVHIVDHIRNRRVSS